MQELVFMATNTPPEPPTPLRIRIRKRRRNNRRLPDLCPSSAPPYALGPSPTPLTRGLRPILPPIPTPRWLPAAHFPIPTPL